jgi:hypothetical protein
VIISAALERVRLESEHAWFLCKLALAFGLRASEVLRMRPVESDQGDHLLISRGTKGGLQRSVPFSCDPQWRAEQRKLMDKAAQICAGDPKRATGFEGKTLKQARGYLEWIVHRSGGSQTQLGICFHGLRHEYAVRRFEELTGLPAPVLRRAALSAYTSRMDLVRKARQQIAAELGHRRVSVTSAYLGSVVTLRQEAKRARDAAAVLCQYRQELQRMGVAQVTLVVRKTAASQHNITLFMHITESGVRRPAGIAAKVQANVTSWLRGKVRAYLAAAPAQAGSVTLELASMELSK